MHAKAHDTPQVLLADADPWSRELLAQLVLHIRCDAVLHNHADGDSALQACRKQPFTLILAEQNLPGLNGLDLLRGVRQLKRQPPQPFILISSRSDATTVRAALPLAPTAYLAKPFNAEDLLKRLRDLLQGDEAPVCALPAISPGVELESFLGDARLTTEGAPLFVDVQALASQCLSAGQCDLTLVVATFASDPQITACLIAAANSAAQHDGEPVRTLNQALKRLGMGASLNLALGFALKRGGQLHDPQLQARGERFCQQARRSAELARELAFMVGADAEACYTAGLLHCLGDLAVLRSLQDWCNAGQALGELQITQALREYGASFGSALRTRWRLPLEMRQLIAAAYQLGSGVFSREALVLHLATQAALLSPGSNPAVLLESKAARLLKLDPARLHAWLEPGIAATEPPL
ncbi:MAG: HDOD domain-containing protein [Pseudomonas sp.]